MKKAPLLCRAALKNRFGWILGGKNKEASCGDIEKDFCYVGKNDELS
jgi:hypothetical protein